MYTLDTKTNNHGDKMESKIDRKMCGTCVHWNGGRELMAKENKVKISDELGKCRCSWSYQRGKILKKELSCRCYESLSVIF